MPALETTATPSNNPLDYPYTNLHAYKLDAIQNNHPIHYGVVDEVSRLLNTHGLSAFSPPALTSQQHDIYMFPTIRISDTNDITANHRHTAHTPPATEVRAVIILILTNQHYTMIIATHHDTEYRIHYIDPSSTSRTRKTTKDTLATSDTSTQHAGYNNAHELPKANNLT